MSDLPDSSAPSVRRAVIFTFSQTGATEQVAGAVVSGLQARGVACEALDMLRVSPQAAAEAELIGIGTPVFYYKEPTIVRDFIERLPKVDGRPAFTFITHGGNPVNTLRRMQKQLARRGYIVLNSFSCAGYDSYPMFFRTWRQWGHPSAKELELARDFGERLMDEVRWLKEEPHYGKPSYPFVGGKYFLMSLLFGGGRMTRFFPQPVPRKEVCTRCGVCARNCPTSCITMTPYPTVGSQCMWCYLCERICPVQAYQLDWSGLRARMKV